MGENRILGLCVYSVLEDDKFEIAMSSARQVRLMKRMELLIAGVEWATVFESSNICEILERLADSGVKTCRTDSRTEVIGGFFFDGFLVVSSSAVQG